MRSMCIFLFLISCLLAGAQDDRQLISSLGGQLSGASTTLSFALGETVVETFSTPQGMVNQGFYQHFDFVSGSKAHSLHERIVLYPNPFQDEIRFSVLSESLTGRLTIILTNMLGQVLIETSIALPVLDNFVLDTRTLGQGIYLITLVSDQMDIKSSYKLTKQI